MANKFQVNTLLLSGQALTADTSELYLNGSRMAKSSHTGQFVSSFQTGTLVSRGETGNEFYPRFGNPNGYITGVGFVNLSSNQTISGIKTFNSDVNVSGTGNFALGLFVSGRAVVLTPSVKAKTAIFTNPEGIYSGSYQAVSYKCTQNAVLTGIHAWRFGGSGCFVNAYKNSPALPHLSVNMNVSSTGQWISSGTITNANYSINDTLILSITSISGLPTSVTMQADFVD